MVKPYLESKFTNSWPDQRDYKSIDEFLYAYSVMRGWAIAGREILEWVDQMAAKYDFLLKKERGELESKFHVGR